MSTLIHYLVRYGVSLVFLNVFAEQIGMPVPAVPTLIVAGAEARHARVPDLRRHRLAALGGGGGGGGAALPPPDRRGHRQAREPRMVGAARRRLSAGALHSFQVGPARALPAATAHRARVGRR